MPAIHESRLCKAVKGLKRLKAASMSVFTDPCRGTARSPGSIAKWSTTITL